MKLYELDIEIQRLLWLLEPDPETGEIPDNEEQLMSELNALQMERSRVLEFLAKLVLNSRAEQNALKTEEQRLHDRRGKLERQEERLMRILDRECNGETTDCGVASVRYRATTKVDVTNLTKAVSWLRRHKRQDCIRVRAPEVDKNLVRALLKEGAKIPGLTLLQERSCSLK